MAPGLENAIATVWDGVPVQWCTVQSTAILAHAPERLPRGRVNHGHAGRG
jgi:putative transposase